MYLEAICLILFSTYEEEEIIGFKSINVYLEINYCIIIFYYTAKGIQMKELLQEIKKCHQCEMYLPHTPNPVLAAHEKSEIVIIGQAPGRVVNETGIPWNDKSGERLRDWLGVTTEQFYDPVLFALLPMGFCYPGTGKSGDLPPRKECAPLWHEKIWKKMPNVKCVLLIGNYAQNYYLIHKPKTLTDTVKEFKSYLPQYFPLPHPSPRNNIWLKKNRWFEVELLPTLKEIVASILNRDFEMRSNN